MRRFFLMIVFLGVGACSANPQATDETPTEDSKTVEQADPTDPVAEFQAGCDADSAGDCLNLGFRYERGEGVEVDPTKAHDLFDKACVLGSPAGCYAQALVLLYEENNPVRAHILLEYTCDEQYWPSCVVLGDLYREGFGVIKKEKLALELYRKACEGGYHKGCEAYNEHLWTASKQLESLEEYVTFLGNQCNAGHAGSCVELAKLYRDGARWVGYELEVDEAKARKLFAEAGRLKRRVAPQDTAMLSTRPPADSPQEDVVDDTPRPEKRPGVVNITGAEGQEIVVDGVATGKVSPDTVLILKFGKHTIQLRDYEGKLSKPTVVFIESGTKVDLSF